MEMGKIIYWWYILKGLDFSSFSLCLKNGINLFKWYFKETYGLKDHLILGQKFSKHKNSVSPWTRKLYKNLSKEVQPVTPVSLREKCS